MADGHNPWEEPYIIDVDVSIEWRPNNHALGRVPCLTYSRTAGLWITNRGRRMSPAECMRIQGISARQTSGLPDSFIRACVGNSMSVPVVSTLIDCALALVKTVKLAPLAMAQSATIENSRRDPERPTPPRQPKHLVPHKDSIHFGILEHKRPLAIKAHEFATAGKRHLGNIHNKLARLKQPLVLDAELPTAIIERTTIRGPSHVDHRIQRPPLRRLERNGKRERFVHRTLMFEDLLSGHRK